MAWRKTHWWFFRLKTKVRLLLASEGLIATLKSYSCSESHGIEIKDNKSKKSLEGTDQEPLSGSVRVVQGCSVLRLTRYLATLGGRYAVQSGKG